MRKKYYKMLYLVIPPLIAFVVGVGNILAVGGNDVVENVSLEKYLSSYEEMEANSDPENIIIVRNDKKPEDYGAERVVEAPDNTYYLQYKTAEDRKNAWEQLRKDDLTSVVPNIKIQRIANDTSRDDFKPNWTFTSWGTEAMGLDNAISSINSKKNANSVLIAVIDSGVNEAAFHRRFPDRSLEGYCMPSATCNNGMVDTNGHGTHVIGIVAEGTAKNVKLLMVRDSVDEDVYLSESLAALNYTASKKPDVINYSAGGYYDLNDTKYNPEYGMTEGELARLAYEEEKRAYTTVTKAGITVVAAAGNDGDNPKFDNQIHCPSCFEDVISVGAVTENKDHVAWSNHDASVDFVAPGVGIWGLSHEYKGEEEYLPLVKKDGTSMAAPHVAAAVADLLSFNKNLTNNQIMSLLRSKGIDLGDKGKDDYYGYGFIDFSETVFCGDEMECDNLGVFAIEKSDDEQGKSDDDKDKGDDDQDKDDDDKDKGDDDQDKDDDDKDKGDGEQDKGDDDQDKDDDDQDKDEPHGAIIWIQGKNYIIGEDKDLIVKVDYAAELLSSVKMDKKELDKDDYKVESGSTVLTVYSRYIDTLEPGKHTIKLAYNDGNDVDINFNVAEEQIKVPKTSSDFTTTPDTGTNTKNSEQSGTTAIIIMLPAAIFTITLGCRLYMSKKHISFNKK